MWSNIYWLLISAILGGIIGSLFNVLAWGVIFGLLVYQSYFFWSLQRFYTWAIEESDTRPPSFQYYLERIASHIYQTNQQKKLANQHANALTQKIRVSLNALPDAILLINQKDCVEWWNQSAEQLLNLKSTDKNLHILSIIRSPSFHQYYKNIDEYIDGVRLNIWQNQERYIQCEITSFGEEKLLVVYDVTRLQLLERMQKDFVANVSHELRTPLTVIQGYVEMLIEHADDDPRWQRIYQRMMQQSQRMEQIISDLLFLSRLENGEKPVAPDHIDMPKLLTQLFDEAQIYNKGHEHLIHLHIDSQKHLLGYEKFLNSALINLITNAIRYTPKGGIISINWYETKNGVCFSVTDNGFGIEKHHLERLTERFYRADSSRSRETGGTGLGLAIVKHVLHQHEATLNIQSTIDKGSTFSVIFPKSRMINP